MRIISTILVLSLFAPSLWAQEETPAAAQPKVSVPKPNYDFGRVMSGEKVRHIYEIKNEGDAVLKLSRPRTSCGCTSALLDKPDVAPGKKARIEAKFKTHGRVGNQTKVITVQTNDPAAPKVEMRLTGMVQSPLTAKPEFVYFPGGKLNEDPVRLYINNYTNPNFALTGISASSKNILVMPEQPLGSFNKVQRITIQLNKETPRGTLSEKVALFTNDPLQPVIWIPVWGRN